jgi:predicted peroxiredoxin
MENKKYLIKGVAVVTKKEAENIELSKKRNHLEAHLSEAHETSEHAKIDTYN